VSTQCSSWLINTVEAACLVKENIAKSFREGDKALMVHEGAYKVGRFLEVVVLAEGGRKGGLWLPEGRDGWGWRRFRPLPSSKSSPTKFAEVRVFGVCSKVRTFVEILKLKPQSCVEENSGVDLRREAAVSVKTMRGSNVKS
jgi:hypothetical protein